MVNCTAGRRANTAQPSSMPQHPVATANENMSPGMRTTVNIALRPGGKAARKLLYIRSVIARKRHFVNTSYIAVSTTDAIS